METLKTRNSRRKPRPASITSPAATPESKSNSSNGPSNKAVIPGIKKTANHNTITDDSTFSEPKSPKSPKKKREAGQTGAAVSPVARDSHSPHKPSAANKTAAKPARSPGGTQKESQDPKQKREVARKTGGQSGRKANLKNQRATKDPTDAKRKDTRAPKSPSIQTSAKNESEQNGKSPPSTNSKNKNTKASLNRDPRSTDDTPQRRPTRATNKKSQPTPNESSTNKSPAPSIAKELPQKTAGTAQPKKETQQPPSKRTDKKNSNSLKQQPTPQKKLPRKKRKNLAQQVSTSPEKDNATKTVGSVAKAAKSTLPKESVKKPIAADVEVDSVGVDPNTKFPTEPAEKLVVKSKHAKRDERKSNHPDTNNSTSKDSVSDKKPHNKSKSLQEASNHKVDSDTTDTDAKKELPVGLDQSPDIKAPDTPKKEQKKSLDLESKNKPEEVNPADKSSPSEELALELEKRTDHTNNSNKPSPEVKDAVDTSIGAPAHSLHPDPNTNKHNEVIAKPSALEIDVDAVADEASTEQPAPSMDLALNLDKRTDVVAKPDKTSSPEIDLDVVATDTADDTTAPSMDLDLDLDKRTDVVAKPDKTSSPEIDLDVVATDTTDDNTAPSMDLDLDLDKRTDVVAKSDKTSSPEIDLDVVATDSADDTTAPSMDLDLDLDKRTDVVAKPAEPSALVIDVDAVADESSAEPQPSSMGLDLDLDKRTDVNVPTGRDISTESPALDLDIDKRTDPPASTDPKPTVQAATPPVAKQASEQVADNPLPTKTPTEEVEHGAAYPTAAPIWNAFESRNIEPPKPVIWLEKPLEPVTERTTLAVDSKINFELSIDHKKGSGIAISVVSFGTGKTYCSTNRKLATNSYGNWDLSDLKGIAISEIKGGTTMNWRKPLSSLLALMKNTKLTVDVDVSAIDQDIYLVMLSTPSPIVFADLKTVQITINSAEIDISREISQDDNFYCSNLVLGAILKTDDHYVYEHASRMIYDIELVSAVTTAWQYVINSDGAL